MIRKLPVVIVIAFCVWGPLRGAQAAPSGCQAKELALQREIEYARQHGNIHREEGLTRALANVRLWCSDERLYKDARQEVAELERKVDERRRELAEAQAKGDKKKIQKRERKLEESLRKLQERQKELQGLE